MPPGLGDQWKPRLRTVSSGSPLAMREVNQGLVAACSSMVQHWDRLRSKRVSSVGPALPFSRRGEETDLFEGLEGPCRHETA